MFLAKRKNGYFFIQYLDPSKNQLRRQSTKTKSKNEALKFFRNFDPGLTIKKDGLKISRFRDEYMEYVTNDKSKKYIKSIGLSFRQLLRYSKDIPLEDLDARLLDQFVSKKFSTSPAAALLYFRTLKAALSKAVVWGYIDENPLKKIKPPRLKKSLPVFISKSELELILDKTKTVMLKDLFTTAFYTGMRLGEIVNLVWECVDFKRKVIIVKNINGFTTKNKKERIIPMNSTLETLMMNRFSKTNNVDNNNYIFYRVIGIKLNEDYVSKKFKVAVRDAGLNDNIHFHTLRHSFASRLIQKGASVFVVKELLGHEDIKTTQIYSHLQTQDLIEAVNLL
ncbi:MAG: tyrosine-type recombinase/integrase [Bacteroidetes bacterium]|nr:tyrosine-type recombinase/integrase [Bacteroidota bacterium]